MTRDLPPIEQLTPEEQKRWNEEKVLEHCREIVKRRLASARARSTAKENAYKAEIKMLRARLQRKCSECNILKKNGGRLLLPIHESKKK